MFFLFKSPHFLRKAHKLIGKNPTLDPKLLHCFQLMKHDPFSASLRTHHVIARIDGKSAMSSRVTNDVRILWRHDAEEATILDLIDLGGHSGGKKVYR